jgi:predicted TPR repeat methyltransferase
VFHFIAGLEAIFDEARRVLKPGGVLAFTTRAASAGGGQQKQFERLLQGEFEIFSHQVDYLDRLLEGRAFTRAKFQRAFVGDDLFNLWVARLA